MIINATNSQASASLLQSAQARLQKATARAGAETAAPADSATDSAVIISQNMASTLAPLQDLTATLTAL